MTEISASKQANHEPRNLDRRRERESKKWNSRPDEGTSRSSRWPASSSRGQRTPRSVERARDRELKMVAGCRDPPRGRGWLGN